MTAKEALNKINVELGTQSPVVADLCCIINRELEELDYFVMEIFLLTVQQ